MQWKTPRYVMPRHKSASAPVYRTLCFKFPVMCPKKLLGIFVYLVSTPKIISKLFWVLILVKTSEWIETVWPFRDNATWNLIFKSIEKIREVQFDWSTLKKHIKFCSHWHQKKGVSLCLHVQYLCCKKINFFEILLIC